MASEPGLARPAPPPPGTRPCCPKVSPNPGLQGVPLLGRRGHTEAWRGSEVSRARQGWWLLPVRSREPGDGHIRQQPAQS